jgi:hypothetical protein
MINPYPVQFTTWLLAIVAALLMFIMARQRVIPWRLTIMPGVIVAQYIFFYSWLIFYKPPGEWAWISAIVRLQEMLVFVSFLAIHWYRAWIWIRRK